MAKTVLTSKNSRFPDGQYRVFVTHYRRRNTILPSAQPKNGCRHYLASGFYTLHLVHWALTGNIPLWESLVGGQPQPITSGLAQAGFTSRDKYVKNQILTRVVSVVASQPAPSLHVKRKWWTTKTEKTECQCEQPF
jgi:hypothetical protein